MKETVFWLGEDEEDTAGQNSRNAQLILMESGSFHSTLRFRGLHECFPYKTGAQIFRHQQDDSSINSDHIGVIPVLQRIERVHEAVLGPGRWIASLDGPQDLHCGRGQKR